MNYKISPTLFLDNRDDRNCVPTESAFLPETDYECVLQNMEKPLYTFLVMTECMNKDHRATHPLFYPPTQKGTGLPVDEC